ncbi:hypothetical protein SDC9_102383 [bioreactor metagenome]|uniref:Uncharacterized protein n=1 Tax=bioreactor metagenome TaxID=1076179 RepID=A0A645ARQ3_9ZZZZ
MCLLALALFGVPGDFFLRPAVEAEGKKRVPHSAADFAFLEQPGPAGRAGIGLLFLSAVRQGNPVHRAPCPEHELPRACPDGILADRAQEPLVSLPVLLRKPLGPGEGHDPDDGDQDPDDRREKPEDNDILEVPRREIPVDHEGRFHKHRAAEGEKKGKVDAPSFPGGKVPPGGQQGEQDRQLEGGQPEIMLLVQPFVLFPGGFPLLFDGLLDPGQFRFEDPFPLRQGRKFGDVGLVAFPAFKKTGETLGKVC